jgi:ATP-binding cassette subfamily B multidrug efflux pump
LEIAQAADFIREMPEGLEARVAQGGTNFSGGQRQRLSIARAIVKRPQIYILDDSFSALDYSTDAKLRASLEQSAGNATVLLVAQRVSTILAADQIVVLDEGKIVGIGKHHDLMKACATYREIVLSQLSPEEAA